MTLIRFTSLAVATLALAGLLALSVSPVALAQGALRSSHGAWQIRCETPPGAPGEQCALIQSVTASDRDNVGLMVIVLKTADQDSRIMRVVAPLGIFLPTGLGLRVDNADVGRAAFVRCLPSGCVAEIFLEDQVMSQLRSGSDSTFIIFQTPEEGIGIPVLLDGFGEGFDALP